MTIRLGTRGAVIVHRSQRVGWRVYRRHGTHSILIRMWPFLVLWVSYRVRL